MVKLGVQFPPPGSPSFLYSGTRVFYSPPPPTLAPSIESSLKKTLTWLTSHAVLARWLSGTARSLLHKVIPPIA